MAGVMISIFAVNPVNGRAEFYLVLSNGVVLTGEF